MARSLIQEEVTMETKSRKLERPCTESRFLAVVILGNILYALAVKLFFNAGGAADRRNYRYWSGIKPVPFGVPVASFVFIFNVTMLLIGWKVMGRKFALTTVVSTFVYPIALGFLKKLFRRSCIDNGSVFMHCFFGTWHWRFIRDRDPCRRIYWWYGYSPLVLNHYFKIPVSVSMYVFDFCILLVQAVGNPPEKVLYGLILVMTYTLVLDKLMLMGTTRTEVRVISEHAQEIAKPSWQKWTGA